MVMLFWYLLLLPFFCFFCLLLGLLLRPSDSLHIVEMGVVYNRPLCFIKRSYSYAFFKVCSRAEIASKDSEGRVRGRNSISTSFFYLLATFFFRLRVSSPDDMASPISKKLNPVSQSLLLLLFSRFYNASVSTIISSITTAFLPPKIVFELIELLLLQRMSGFEKWKNLGEELGLAKALQFLSISNSLSFAPEAAHIRD